MRDAVAAIDDECLRQFDRLADQARPRRAVRRVRAPSVDGKRTRAASTAPLAADLPFPLRCEYRFGSGEIAEVGRGRDSSTKQRRRTMLAELQALCSGNYVDLDRALAAVLTRLDSQRNGDSFAVFVDTWAVDGEDIYTALARRVGTAETVSCPDAMLDAWMHYCVPKSSPTRRDLARGTSRATAGFHAAFAAYHRYRTLCETIGLVTLLAPDQRLPEVLAQRFEDNARNGNYSTRAILELMLAAFEGDVVALLDYLEQNAMQFPAEPWIGPEGYQPTAALYAAFETLRDRMHELGGAGGTDALLLKSRAERIALRDRIATVASCALLDAIG
ncbi:MAG: hypothetical protein KDE27_08470 [Planctomycetes bacterium]|nr:hypothetical protein [Planctomycetota bacterium]